MGEELDPLLNLEAWEEETLTSEAPRSWYSFELHLTPDHLREHQRQFSLTLSSESLNTKMDWAQGVFSCIFGMLYIWQTFLHEDSPLCPVVAYLDVIAAAIFSLDNLRGWYLAESTMRHLLSVLTIIDLVTVVPVYAMLGERFPRRLIWHMADLWRFMLPARFFRVYLRMDVVLRRKDFQATTIRRQIYRTFNLILSVIFMGAALLQLMLLKIGEGTVDTSFENMIFTAVAITLTLSYPDTGGTTEHMLIVAFILVMVILLPAQISNLITMVSSQSKFAHAYDRPAGYHHVILAGDVNQADFLASFLEEFFHPDHNIHKVQVVVMSPKEPDDEMRELLDDPETQAKARYVKGSVLDTDDLLELARVEDAVALILLTNTSSIYEMSRGTSVSDTLKNRSDAANVMRVLKVRGLGHLDNLRVIMQMIRPENKIFATEAGADVVLCVDQIKMNILAQTCICPGFSTLIANLTRSSGDEMFRPGSFLDEYEHGMGFEIYDIKLPDILKWKTFGEAVELLYSLFDVVLFGLLIVFESGEQYYSLNPGRSYIIQGGETAFIIGADSEDAEAIGEVQHYMDCPGLPARRPLKPIPLMRPVLAPSMYPEASREVARHIYRDVMDRAPDIVQSMSNHILVISFREVDSGFRHFFEPLRNIHLKKQHPIVVLAPTLPDEAMWCDYFSDVPDLFFVRGSALSKDDLEMVQPGPATRVVVFANVGDYELENDGEEEFVDADAVFAILMVRDLQEDYYTKKKDLATFHRRASSRIVELNYTSSMHLLRPQRHMIEDPFQTPNFAAGLCFAESLLDMMMCQAFHSDHFARVITELMTSKNPGEPEAYMFGDEEVTQSQVFHKSLPKGFAGRPYCDLFKHLISQDTISLGLYRSRAEHEKTQLPFVFTCPRPDTILFKEDHVLCILRP